MRGVVAIRTAVTTGQKSMSIGERLRWEELPDEGDPEDELDAEEQEGIGFWGKVAVGPGGLIGAGIQIAAFRIGPVVIAKEAGLEGAAFIIADAAIRLVLLLGMLLLLSLFRPFRKILKYHGAEHKAIAALEAGKPAHGGGRGRASAGSIRGAARRSSWSRPSSRSRSTGRCSPSRASSPTRRSSPPGSSAPRSSRRSPSRSSARRPGTPTARMALPLLAGHVGPAADHRASRPEPELEVACAALAVALEESEPVEAKSPEQVRADRDPAAVISPSPLS